MKFNKLSLTLLCVWNYAQAAIKMQLIDDDISDVLDSCDYTRFDNQLIKLQLGNDILQQNMSNMQKNLDRQMDIFNDLQRKVNSQSQQRDDMQEELLQNIRLNMEDLKGYIRKENQMQTAIVPPVDDKIVLITDMKEILHKHDQILEEIKRKQDDTQTLLKEINLEKHTHGLIKTISDKLAIVPQIGVRLSKIENSTISRDLLTDIISNQENTKDKLGIIPQMDARLSKIENSTISRDLLTDVISNQENTKDKLAIIPQMDARLNKIESSLISRNILADVIGSQERIKSLLKEIDLEKWTQNLTKAISDKLAILPQLNAKLSQIERTILPKMVHLQLFHDIQRVINSTKDATKICFKEDNQNIFCTSNVNPTSCADYDVTTCGDNKCPIINDVYGRKPFLVTCNNSVDNGGWTVIQRRLNGSVDFFRDWSDYKTGFGEIDGEFFIGLDKLHALTSTLKPVELYIQLEYSNSTMKYAKYDDFLVGNETENYKLKKVGLYTGNAGDSFSGHKGFEFTTKDRDNDKYDKNCAITCIGAWWYDHCYYSNLNGRYNVGILWFGISRNISLNFVEMLIRPKRL